MATTTAASKRDSVRLSTYSGAPSLQPSIAMSNSTSNTTSQDQTSPADTMNDTQKSGMSDDCKSSPYLSASTTYGSEKMGFNPAAASTSTLASTDPRSQDIKTWSAGFERMQDERLEKQRYIMSGKKSDEVSITALGAKVERALGRRMTGQDAVFTSRRPDLQELPAELPEKRSMEVEATS